MVHCGFRSTFCGFQAVFSFPSLAAGVCALGAPTSVRPKTKYSTLALDLVQRTTVIDMLGLLTLDYRKLGTWETNPDRFQPGDFQRLRIPGSHFPSAVRFHVQGDIYKQSLAGHHRLESLHRPHQDQFMRKPGDIEHAKAKGKIGIVIGQQNSGTFPRCRRR